LEHRSEFLASFQSSLDTLPLPERISGRYELASALGHRPEGSTFLLRRREDGASFVLKIDTGNQNLAEEYSLLGRLRKGIAPEPVDYFEKDGVQYLIRSYLPGKPLAECWEAGSERWVELGAKLCGLLSELHSMEPPIVHRDIKPENIIISPEGEPYLIDFGIARSYKSGQETDTVHMGTPSTAAPEQYGFAQSGPRTDLYALGVTLRWMVTGSYRPEALDNADCPAWTKRFLRKAAAFDPEDRFPSAEAMAAALRRRVRTRRGISREHMLTVCCAALTVCCLALTVCCVSLVRRAGLWEGQQDANTPPAEDNAPTLSDAPADSPSPLPENPSAPPKSLSAEELGETVTFNSETLELAVRAALDKPEGDVTKADLATIRRLAVVGRTILTEGTQFYCNMNFFVDMEPQDNKPRGDISDLSLLAYMPNLNSLMLCRQDISDISALEGLHLTELYLYGNSITDLSPLEGMGSLEVLNIGVNPISDITPLASLSALRDLNMDFFETNDGVVNSLAPLEGLPLTSLSLNNLIVLDGDWSLLGSFERLKRLSLWTPPPQAVEALAGCSAVETLILGSFWHSDLSSLPVLPSMTRLELLNHPASLEGIQKQDSLLFLSMCNMKCDDLSPASELPALQVLELNNVSAPSYAPLLESGSLIKVRVAPEENMAAVEAECPNRRFDITW